MLYWEIFRTSFLSALALPMGSESAYFALLYFGEQQEMLLPTLIAFVATVLATSLNYAVGYGLAHFKEHYAFHLAEDQYVTFVRWMKYGALILLMPGFPFVPAFFAFLCGFARIKLLWFFSIVFIGRAVYYGLHLQQNGFL